MSYKLVSRVQFALHSSWSKLIKATQIFKHGPEWRLTYLFNMCRKVVIVVVKP